VHGIYFAFRFAARALTDASAARAALARQSGRLMFQIIGAMAEFERSLIQKRVRGHSQCARQRQEVWTPKSSG
jgi:DNA invertase Pin-like site-specific DNA recombinase